MGGGFESILSGVSMGTADGELVRQCLDGRREAYADLVVRHQAGLVAYLTGRLSDRDRAEEVAQEAFVRAYAGVGKVRKAEAFFSWLVGIANRVVQERQRVGRLDDQTARALATRPRSAERDDGLDLERAIGRLSKRQRDVVLLRFYDGLSCGEVAEQLGIPVGTVTKTLSRAYANLREHIGQDADLPEGRS